MSNIDERIVEESTWYSNASCSDGMYTSNSMYSPVSGFIKSASFLAFIIMLCPCQQIRINFSIRKNTTEA